jgi:hypothetical protein
MITDRDFPDWIIRWSVMVGAAALFWLFGETINDTIDGYNLAVDYFNWCINFWYGG